VINLFSLIGGFFMFLHKEKYYDEFLSIHTRGEQKGFHSSHHYHRYEPTPYLALEELFDNYSLTENDRVVDFGCGKGRLNFYLHHFFHTAVVGVEMDEDFYREARINLISYGQVYKKNIEKIQFFCCLAEEYEINRLDNRFYFFNPFSLKIFIKVVNRILQSVEQNYREVDLILYYPSDDYLYYLENQTSFYLFREVKLSGVFEPFPNERFNIYRLNY
jgi:SAM-dependent methyltransferase